MGKWIEYCGVEYMKPFKLLQITDPHLGSQIGGSLLGMDTDNSLIDVLDSLRGVMAPDLIVATGDISKDGGLPSYIRFLKIVDEYFPSVPLAWLAGNHDNTDNMISIGGHPIENHYQAGHWNFILLDSHVPGETGGHLSVDELERLDSELSKRPNTPAIVFLHHQPVPVGSHWIDRYVVDNSQDFFDVIDKHPQVKVVSWGHVHQEFYARHNHIDLMATPSTCIQFEPNSNDFKLSEAMPGYRTYDLFSNGRYQTHVSRVALQRYTIDFASTGYS